MNLKEHIINLSDLISEIPGIRIKELNDIFKSDEKVKSFANAYKNNLDVLTIFHDAYDSFQDKKISINEGLIRRIKLMDNKYYDLLRRLRDLKNRIENSEILSEEEVNDKLQKRILEMNSNDIKDSLYKKEIETQRQLNGIFSISAEFEMEPTDEINGVTLITPTQTYSRFIVDNCGVHNGHDATFDEISKAIYGKTFDGHNGQDIKIRYINSGMQYVLFEVPFPINSTQKKSLEYLNEEIKKFEKETGQDISVYSRINDYYNDLEDIVDTGDEMFDLDFLLSKVIVDDNFVPRYTELHLVGYPNNENHYNNTLHKVENTNDSRVIK